MGFFEKMKTSDIFVILDDVQYKKNNWQNRNKFINKNGVEEFFGVQVEKNAHKKLTAFNPLGIITQHIPSYFWFDSNNLNILM